MLAYTTYSEAGGVGKTTTAVNLAVAHARAGLDVLLVPLDPQDANLSRLLGIDDQRTEAVDNLVRHLIDRPEGAFDHLIRTVEGVDIVPEHNQLADLGDILQREQRQAEKLGEAFGMYAQLHRVLREGDVPDRYDVLIVDPPATEGPHLYNAVYATRSLVIPVEPSAKGEASVQGLEALVAGLQDNLDIDVGVLAAVPTGFNDTREGKRVVKELDYSAPIVIRQRGSLMGGCWKRQCSAYRYVDEHRTWKRTREMETLANYDLLARYLEQEVGLEAPDPSDLPEQYLDDTEVVA